MLVRTTVSRSGGPSPCTQRSVSSTAPNPTAHLRGFAAFGFGSEPSSTITLDPSTAWSTDRHFAVNAPLLQEILARRGDSPQTDLPLAAEGVLRYVWESRFGSMLIEVENGRAYVNGQAVEPVEASGTSNLQS